MGVTVEHLGAVQFQSKTRGHSIVSGTRVRASCEKVNDPVARMTNFVIEVDAPMELTKDQRKGLDQAVANCWCTIPSGTLLQSRSRLWAWFSQEKAETYAASILPRSSFRIFAATVAVSPERSRTGLNSTTSAPTIGEGSA